MLQGIGWCAYTALQLAVGSSDPPVAGVSPLLPALLLSALALAGSLGLRLAYRHAQAARLSEIRILALVAASSVAAALVVDALFYACLWLASMANPSLSALHSDQPLLAHAPLLVIAYFLWSLLYVALSRQQRLRQAELAEGALQLALKEAQLQALLGQLNPHFMFNAINNIRALVLRDADAARAMLGKFAATLRYQFSQQETPLVTVAEELAVVRDYIDLVRLQLGERLRYAEHIDPQALPKHLPRHSLQLLVENAIKHGLGLTAAPGELRIDIGAQAGGLDIDVRNTGTLRDRALSTGTGLNNLEQRLRLSFGSSARFGLRQDGGAVLASLRIGAPA